MPKINHENATKQEKHHMRNEVIPSLNTKVITHWMVEQDTVSNMLGLHNILMFLKFSQRYSVHVFQSAEIPLM